MFILINSHGPLLLLNQKVRFNIFIDAVKIQNQEEAILMDV